MGEIFVVVEHRAGEIREITFQMLWKANELAQAHSHGLTAVLLCDNGDAFLPEIKDRADRIIVVEDEQLKHFNGERYKEILKRLIEEYRPFLTLIGHTPWGMELAPALSVKTGLPLITDGIDIKIEDGNPKVIRQIYSGKLFSKVSFKASEGYLITLRPGACPADKVGDRHGDVSKQGVPTDIPESRKRFVEFVDTAAGELDISQADFLISIGRGIGEEENIKPVQELAKMMGGVISCSRPVVDKNWLPKFHQVGTSGKTVKPKVYLALGISGAFQHVAGIGGAGTVIAVNKDKKAPIFRVADYGVVDDLFKVVEALKEKLKD
jgi:electron transfer flavoprotein alpha subunit